MGKNSARTQRRPKGKKEENIAHNVRQGKSPDAVVVRGREESNELRANKLRSSLKRNGMKEP